MAIPRPSPPRATKIVATLGPATDKPGELERLLAAGVDVVRLNLSHASPREHAERVKRLRACKPQVAVLADLGGPKLRLGDLPSEVTVEPGQSVLLGSAELPVAERFVEAGRVAHTVARVARASSAVDRPWVPVGDDMVIEDWAIRGAPEAPGAPEDPPEGAR